jgi:hypothetical protein
MANNFVVGAFVGCNGCSLALDANGKMCIGAVGGVTQITAGTGITISPACGTGNVTICGSAASVMVAGTGTCSIKGNGCGNTACGNFSFIGGGCNNIACGVLSSVLGGLCNCATSGTGGSCGNFVVGGQCNVASGTFSLVEGGQGNNSCGTEAIIVGGCNNKSCGANSAVVNGGANTASGSKSFIGNGLCNTASGSYSSVLNGTCNVACGNCSAILGGCGNTASGLWSGAFGCNLTASADCTFYSNNLCATGISSAGTCVTSPVTCGTTSVNTPIVNATNCVTATNLVSSATICGTTAMSTPILTACNACITALSISGCAVCVGASGLLTAFTAGGGGGIITCGTGTCSTLRCGVFNSASGCYSFAGGGCNNTVCSNFSFIGGGQCNCDCSFGGGNNNILGGVKNLICVSAGCSTISGGYCNILNSSTSVISGGKNNTIDSVISGFIGGGDCNTLCFGSYSSVLDGFQNVNCGGYSTIISGCCNIISGGCTNFTGSGICSTNSGCYNFIGNGFKCFSVAGNTICNCNLGASILNGQANCIPNSPFGGCVTCFGTILGGCANSVCESFTLAYGCGNSVGGCFSAAIGCGLMASSACTFYVNNMCVCGTLSKSSGSFKIPHPDPIKAECGKFLKHSFVESPTAGDNIYRFNVTTLNCSASIELPDYYSLLNDNDQVYVNAKKHLGYGFGIVNDEQTRVDITTNNDGEYNVLLIGTRKDKLALDAWNGTEVNDVENK